MAAAAAATTTTTMYVRVKRDKTTLFLQAEPSTTIAELKAQIAQLLGRPADQQRLLRLGDALQPQHASAGGRQPPALPLEDDRTLAELRIENDAALALVYGSGEEWEEPHVADPARAAAEGGSDHAQPDDGARGGGGDDDAAAAAADRQTDGRA
mmetsp:Transcript_5953/g.21783  ORF Transcript_5953/g.21783 Transcript_5953/m.21783 type:complete len:154 (+) Transcript_5953:218-679(+)